MPTIVLVFTMLGLFVAAALLWALLLRCGLRWANVPDRSMRAVAWATALLFVLHLAYTAGSYFVSTIEIVPTLVHVIADVVAAILIPCLVIRQVFQASLWQSLRAWLTTLLAGLVLIPVVFLLVRPFLFEAYVCPTNSMAPTLLGRHWQDTCVECGSPAYSTPMDDIGGYANNLPSMICRDHFHITSRTEPGTKVLAGDRFFVAKFLKAARWDLVVFRFPEDPSQMYVKRLVGLPGETITIADGQIRANGKLLTPPDSLRGLEYQSKDRYGLDDLWGSPRRPAHLGDDEYFVLGDFTTQARDSRHWEFGAPGHQPFAVPASHLIGVATHTYWPPSRWRAFR